MTTELVVSRGDREGWSVVRVTGEIDLATAAEFEQSLRDALQESPRLVVDLTACGFMDSTGLRALLGAFQQAGENGHVRLAVSAGPVQQLLEVTGIDERFPVHPSVAAAISA